MENLLGTSKETPNDEYSFYKGLRIYNEEEWEFIKLHTDPRGCQVDEKVGCPFCYEAAFYPDQGE